jgi:hypothetical protein
MSELRDLVLDAHGGIARWRKLKRIEGDMSITGALWARKGWSDVLRDVHVTADVWGQTEAFRPPTIAPTTGISTESRSRPGGAPIEEIRTAPRL